MDETYRECAKHVYIGSSAREGQLQFQGYLEARQLILIKMLHTDGVCSTDVCVCHSGFFPVCLA